MVQEGIDYKILHDSLYKAADILESFAKCDLDEVADYDDLQSRANYLFLSKYVKESLTIVGNEPEKWKYITEQYLKPPSYNNRTRNELPKKCKEEVIQRDGNKCRVCGKEQSLSIHHILPHSLNGLDSPENLMQLCQECHKKVSKKDPLDILINAAIKGKASGGNCTPDLLITSQPQ